ncbi:MAG TPA: carboxypeptidase-like regulatory domain-containing protein, partial [Niastella sp.]
MKKSNLLHWILTLLMLSCSLSLLAQTKTITGKVTGPDGDALKNASVMIKGQNKGTTTDEGGKYSIEAVNGQVLVFSYTGYAIREITVDTKSVLDVQL